MNSYSEMFEDIVNYDDEDFVENPEKLKNIVVSFRDAAGAMDSFLLMHGYEGNVDDADAKRKFIEKVFLDRGMKPSREIKEFYRKNERLSADKGIELCFAFGLSLSETQEFFRKILLIRGLDLHTINGISYYFCLKNNFTFDEASRIISEIKSVSADDKDITEIFYTSRIKDDVDGFKSSDELIAYLNENISQFKKNNRTARKNILFLWKDLISEKNGKNLLEREREILSKYAYENSEDWGSINLEYRADAISYQTYLQFFGYDLSKGRKIQKAFNKERTINDILKDNEFFRIEAEKEFPTRSSLINIFEDKNVKNETYRKWLILLSFYRFWVKEVVNTTGDEGYFEAEKDDNLRSIEDMNRYLIESGYPELYAGNPYDWIFMYSNMSADPLSTFRQIFGIIYENKEAEIDRLCGENTGEL
jgi:hypothetical protein